MSEENKSIVSAADVEQGYVLFRHKRDNKPRPGWGTIRSLLGNRHRLRNSKDGAAFSLVTYPPGALRGKSMVLHVNALVFDYDHVSLVAAETVLQALKGLAFALYTSYSHQKKGPDYQCFRVIIFSSRPMEPTEFEVIWEVLNARFITPSDPTAKDWSHIYYLPSCPRERVEFARIEWHDGPLLDVDAFLASAPEASKPEKRIRERSPDASERSTSPIAEGGRNAHLTRVAGALRRQGCSEEVIRASLLEENAARCIPPLEAEEVDRIAASISTYEPASPLVTLPRTDLGNAERLLHHADGQCIFVSQWDRWHVWDGRRWTPDDGGAMIRLACEAVRATAAQAEHIDDPTLRKEVRQFARKSESAARLQAMVTLARAIDSDRSVQFDAQPFLLNCLNGTLDLRTAQLRPHDRADYLSRLAGAIYDPEARCPHWERVLHRVLGGDDALVDFFQRAVGYTLTGDTSEQVLFLLHGTGANGKSTVVETLRALMGEFGAQADFTSFLEQRGDRVRNDLARLVGMRLVAAGESDQSRALSESVVKQLTGGDPVAVRFLHKEYFEYRPAFKLWLATNHLPRIRGLDHGIWRRVRVIPFTVRLAEHEQDPHLRDKLLSERSGILNWAVQGCLAWQKHGLGNPGRVREATDAYREEMDPAAVFLRECCERDPSGETPVADVHLAFTAWCEHSGDASLSKRALHDALQHHGFETRRAAKGQRRWVGLRLLPPPAIEAGEPARGDG